MRFRGTYPAYDDTILCVGVTNPMMPDIEYEAQKIPQRAGALGIAKTHGVRQIVATYQLNGKSAARNMALAAALALWAESDTAGQIVLDDAPDRFYLGILTDTSKPDYAQDWPEITLTFTCANPYAYSLTQHTANVGETIDYTGSVAVWPTLTFTPEQDLPSGQWGDGTRVLLIRDEEYLLRAGHTFVIDCANRYITEDGVSAMAHLSLLSDWLQLRRGINTITGPGGTVKWRDAYL